MTEENQFNAPWTCKTYRTSEGTLVSEVFDSTLNNVLALSGERDYTNVSRQQAQLIAAAPDMLAALEEAVAINDSEVGEGAGCGRRFSEWLREVIAKAKGDKNA